VKYRNLRETHKTFYCPNGHAQSYTGPSEKDKRIEELETQVCEKTDSLVRQTNRVDFYLGLKNRLVKQRNAIQGNAGRWKRLVTQGRCPICGQLANIGSHLRTKHPRFVKKYLKEIPNE